MIPAFNVSGVLPPYTGGTPVEKNGVSPYTTSMIEIAQRFCTGEARAKLFLGWLEHRNALRTIGLTGFQWLDGSFCENVEGTAGRAPGDVDLVTLFLRPAAYRTDHAAWAKLVSANIHVFDAFEAKKKFNCDAYFIDLSLPVGYVLPLVTYWFGLFTHQRVTNLWKGVLQVTISSDGTDDAAAEKYVTGLSFSP